MPFSSASFINAAEVDSKTEGFGVNRIPSPTLVTDNVESLERCNDSRIAAGIVICPFSLIRVTMRPPFPKLPTISYFLTKYYHREVSI